MDDREQPERGPSAQPEGVSEEPGSGRRSFLVRALSVSVGAVLVGAYGTLAAFIVRFLYPARAESKGWLYVSDIAALAPGSALRYELPDGSPVMISRQGSGAAAEDFVALSSTCPHLGCQVHWEAANRRFFCPCHNGVFSPDGAAVSGPPADAGQSLLRYPLRVSGGLLYIEAPLDRLAAARSAR